MVDSIGSGERQRSDIGIIAISDSFPESYSSRLDVLTPIFQEIKSRESYLHLLKAEYDLSFSAVPYRPEDLIETPPLLLDVTEDGIYLTMTG